MIEPTEKFHPQHAYAMGDPATPGIKWRHWKRITKEDIPFVLAGIDSESHRRDFENFVAGWSEYLDPRHDFR